MKRIAILLVAAAVVVMIVTSRSGAGTPGSSGAGAAQKVDRRPAPPGPRQQPVADHVSSTPHGLPPEADRTVTREGKRVIVDRKPPPADRDGEEEIENGESSNAASTKQMTYRGGPVQTTPRIYLVFWGSTWTTGGDPYGVANRLHYLYQGLGGSSWANVLKQYGSNYGAFTNPANQYMGWSRDTTAVPAHPTQLDIANVAKRAAIRQGDYSYNAQYIVAMPWGVVDQYSTSHQFCGWHNWTYASGSNWVTYTALPYIPYMDAAVFGCGRNKVNASGLLDGVTLIAGHEYAETVNDPGLNAWADSDAAENGDKCAWVNLSNRTLANGYSFPMQPTWSNQWRNQYGYGCYFSA